MISRAGGGGGQKTFVNILSFPKLLKIGMLRRLGRFFIFFSDEKADKNEKIAYWGAWEIFNSNKYF